jgi:hypothetical protein
MVWARRTATTDRSARCTGRAVADGAHLAEQASQPRGGGIGVHPELHVW